MKVRPTHVALPLLLLTLGALAAQHAMVGSNALPVARAPLHMPATAQVERVVDGDTFVARSGRRSVRVRVVGIDTPELHVVTGEPHDCYADQALVLARRVLTGRRVRLGGEVDTVDTYGRVLADVTLLDGPQRGRDLGAIMVAAGAARLLIIPPNDLHAARLRAVALRARDRRRGLWGRCEGAGASLMSPRQR